jgi:hypothetical protein
MKLSKDEDLFHVAEIRPEGLRGLRAQGGKLKEGWLIPVRNGQPFPPGAEIVQGKACAEQGVLSLTTVYKPKGPGQVATPAFRKNYDAVFKSKRTDLN